METVSGQKTCWYCGLMDDSVEASGVWYCPNPRCSGPGIYWFIKRLSSYKEDTREDTYKYDEHEFEEKVNEYLKNKTFTFAQKAPKTIAKVGSTYEDKDGKRYVVIAITNVNTNNEQVVYKPVDKDEYLSCDKKDFEAYAYYDKAKFTDVTSLVSSSAL